MEKATRYGPVCTASSARRPTNHSHITRTTNPPGNSLMHQMCMAAIEGDEKTAREINQKLAALHQFLFVEANPIPVKWALAEMGMIPKGIRLPMTVLSEKYHQSVRDALMSAGVLN